MHGGLYNPIVPTPSAATFIPLYANAINRVVGKFYPPLGLLRTTGIPLSNYMLLLPFICLKTETFDQKGRIGGK